MQAARDERWTAAYFCLTSLVAAFALACSSLPEYAAPKGRLVDPSEHDGSDVVPYRTLTREDFRATEPPPQFAEVRERLGAATCANIVTTPDTQLLVTGRRDPDGRAEFKAVVHVLRFVAEMDRSCSWWNEVLSARAPAYTLEHEQIHLAIFELAARRLNASVEDIRRRIQGQGSSAEEVQTKAQAKLNEVMQEALDAVLARSRDFDEDTSLGYKPAQQKLWLERVTAELQATERWAHPSR